MLRQGPRSTTHGAPGGNVNTDGPPLCRVARWKGAGLLVRLLGRTITCAECGRPMFRAVPYIWRGELRLIGAHKHLVRVSFRWTYALEFRHVELDQCPSPERPWLPTS